MKYFKEKSDVPTAGTIEALKNHKGVILVGNDDDIYRVVFVMEDYRNFRVELKNDRFFQPSLGKHNKSYIVQLCKGNLCRVEMREFLHADIENWVTAPDFLQRRISLKEAGNILANSGFKGVPINETLRQFCLNLMD